MIDKLYLLINKASQVSGLNWPVIFANQNVPRIAKPYIQLNVMTINIPDHMIYSPPDDTGVVTVSGWRRATVELQFYGGITSLDAASRLAMILQSNAVIEYQVEIDVAIGQRLFLSYMPELLNDSQYEGRAIYQFEFFYTESVADNSGIIKGIDLQGCYVQTASDPDPYKVFEVCGDNPTEITCEESIAVSDETIWDDSSTTFDKPGTEWDELLIGTGVTNGNH